MKYLSFGNGDQIPALGLGTWKSEPGEVYQAVREAIRIGYRHIDCAFIYQNETEIGSAFQDAFAAGEVKREDLFVTSKLWNNAHEAEAVMPALKKTLEDLRLDYVDLYLMHWPVAIKPGIMFPENGEHFLGLDEVPLKETWSAMEACKLEGLARHIGVSNFSVLKLQALSREAQIKPEMNQVEMHPFLQQQGLVDYCAGEGILVTAYSPLGSKDRPAQLKAAEEPSLLEHSTIASIAENHQCSPAQVLLAWAIRRNTVVIPKSVNPQRLKQNFEAADIDLTDQEMSSINELDRHFRFITGTFWALEGSPYTLANLWDE